MNKTQAANRKREARRALLIGSIMLAIIVMSAYFGFFEAILPFSGN